MPMEADFQELIDARSLDAKPGEATMRVCTGMIKANTKSGSTAIH